MGGKHKSIVSVALACWLIGAAFLGGCREAYAAEERYEPTWRSLKRHQTPQWLSDAKFGIYTHWYQPSDRENASDFMVEKFDAVEWAELFKQFKKLKSAIEKLIFLEEKILFPTAAKMLSEQEWAEIKKGGPDIGYAWVVPSNLWDAHLVKSGVVAGMPEGAEKTKQPKHDGGIDLSRGALSREQLDLMLKNLPVDITFVDESDRVCYYSESKERIFPRSPAIIGRAVQNCHPPTSVYVVNDIIQSFRDKKRDVAEFWIQLQGGFIHIRYFPVYDGEGVYRGVIEVSQDVTGIRALEGERRILDWE